MADGLLKRKEVLAELGISSSTLSYYVRKGILKPAGQEKNRYLYDPADVERAKAWRHERHAELSERKGVERINHPLYVYWCQTRYACRKGLEAHPEKSQAYEFCWDVYEDFRDWAVSNGWTDDKWIVKREWSKAYSPDNLVIVDAGEGRKKLNTLISEEKRYEHDGIWRTLSEWSKELGIPLTDLKNARIKYNHVNKARTEKLQDYLDILDARPLYTVKGETHNLTDWARITGVSAHTIKMRMTKLGWSVEESILTPVLKPGEGRKPGRKKDETLYEYKGEWKTLQQWSEELGIYLGTLNRARKQFYDQGNSATTVLRDLLDIVVTYSGYYEYNGEIHKLSEWAGIFGMRPSVLCTRVNTFGWSFEKAVTTPSKQYHKMKFYYKGV